MAIVLRTRFPVLYAPNTNIRAFQRELQQTVEFVYFSTFRAVRLSTL